METKTSCSLPIKRDESLNYEGISMQQSLLFSDSLKDLKNLRTQLYSAAEYFEYSYTNDDHKQIVVDTLKDYAIKALVNTVDHLGSATYKVNDLFDEKVDEVSCTELRVSCVEQRLRTCNKCIDHKGLSEHSIVINTPKYHKRYILPVGETMNGANCTSSKYLASNLDEEDDAPLSLVKECLSSVSPPPLSQPSNIPEKELEKHTVSPCEFPILRTGSLSSRENAPDSSGLTTPRPSFERRTFPIELRKSASMFVQDRDRPKETQRNTSKSKRLLQALLSSRRKSKKDFMLYTYLDEY